MPTLLAWSSSRQNNISIIELETKKQYAYFEGAQLRQKFAIRGGWTHVKEIPNTRLLVSLNHDDEVSASMEVYDISKQDQVQKIYSFEEIRGCK